MSKIIYTKTDEAPALATYSLLPIIKAYTSVAGIQVETRDISLAGRILAVFPDHLETNQRIPDHLAELGDLAKTPEANIIKLPNISASIPQMKAAIKELQDHGFNLPEYPDEPKDEKEKEIKSRYDKVKGSAVNPVLREGNSDRRAPLSVKNYARKHPHSMGEWSASSKSHVAHMQEGDFFGSEQSTTVSGDQTVKIVFSDSTGSEQVLKDNLQLLDKEVIDASVMSMENLKKFLALEIEDAKAKDVLFSVHLKATMMKVSDPIIFGAAVSVYYQEVFEKHEDILNQLGVNPNNGIGDLYNRIQSLSEDKRKEIESDILDVYKKNPEMAMVNSDKGITNLHVPSDVIIDASMPAAIRSSGQMWGPDGNLKDMKAVIPDRCYAGVYQETIDFCKENGAFDPKTMGSISNVGLMAQKAEEYGSHDKTFQAPSKGSMKVIADDGKVIFSHEVNTGDIWRMCQVKDAPIQDWIKLAVRRAKATGSPAVFWLNENRAHDNELIKKVNQYLPESDTSGLEIHILSPVKATKFSLARMKNGEDTISVTGNVLRDYLTDLFPILEVGTSAKMLSIVPLMNGGGLFETGAGGSAPKHVQQFEKEGHLRWDSLGEFLALAASLEHLSSAIDNPRARILSQTLDEATGEFLESNRSPSRKVNEIDNRGSHYYLAMYWAKALATQQDDEELQRIFITVKDHLEKAEGAINQELLASQGDPVDIGGYYQPDDSLASKAMRPSNTLNNIIEGIG